MESIDFTERRVHVKWNENEEKRIFLCCLYRFFRRDKQAFEKIFNTRFEENLRNDGFNKGTSFSTLHTQWFDMKRRGDPVWGRVHDSPFDRDGQWRPVLQTIWNVAHSLGIILVYKQWDDIDISGYQPKTPVIRPAVFQDKLPDKPPSLLSQYEPEPTRCLTQFGGKVCWWCQDQESSDRNNSLNAQIPHLLYRWSNTDSQGINTPQHLVAGFFSDTEIPYFPPERITKGQFDRFVLNHVSIARETSPFISTFQSALAPIHRALRGMEGARVSIIDSRRLKTPVFSAKDLVYKNNIHIRGYNGAGEFLIWHEVRTPAIICSFKATTLVQLAQKDKEINALLQLQKIASHKLVRGPLRGALSREPDSVNLNHYSGQGIGRLLRLINVPQEYYQIVGQGIVRSWQQRKKGSWEEFYEGMQLGFFASAQLISPMNMTATFAPENEVTQDNQDECNLVTEDEDHESEDSEEEDEDEEDEDEEDEDEDEEDEDEDEEDEDEDEEDEDEEDDDNDDSVIDIPCPRRMNQSHNMVFNQVEQYNPETRTWSVVRDPSSPTIEHEPSSPPRSSMIVVEEILQQELEELGKIIMANGNSSDSELSGPGFAKDQFASKREQIRRLLQ